MNWKRLTLAGCAGAALWAFGPSVVQACVFPPLADPITHYLCYNAKQDNTFINHPDPGNHIVEDQIGITNYFIKRKPKLFCNPAFKDNYLGPPYTFRPNDHLKCYKYKWDWGGHGWRAEVSNQFGLERLFLRKTKYLCVPTEKDPNLIFVP